MNRIKIDEESNEGDSFYVVDEVYLGGQDSEIKKLINEARKEAYVSGFNRGQSQAYSGFWNESARNYSRKMKRTGSATNMNIAGRRVMR